MKTADRSAVESASRRGMDVKVGPGRWCLKDIFSVPEIQITIVCE